jgi:hypothetical protein
LQIINHPTQHSNAWVWCGTQQLGCTQQQCLWIFPDTSSWRLLLLLLLLLLGCSAIGSWGCNWPPPLLPQLLLMLMLLMLLLGRGSINARSRKPAALWSMRRCRHSTCCCVASCSCCRWACCCLDSNCLLLLLLGRSGVGA